MTYTIKHYDRNKAQLLAGDHLTSHNTYRVDMRVALLTGLQFMVFIDELNDMLELYGDNYGQVYQETYKADLFRVLEGRTFLA